MAREQKKPSPIEVVTQMVAALIFLWILIGPQSETTPAAQSNFRGGSPSRMDSEALRTLRLRFPAGSRSNWHRHSWGQLLMAEQGRGLTQERGGPVREVRAGQPWFTKAGVEHWHGAAPDEDMVQLTLYEGDVVWGDPVTDHEYRAAPAR